MSDRLRAALKEILSSTGQLEPRRLGSASGERREASKQELTRLQADFQDALRFQTRMQLACVVLLGAILLAQGALLVHALQAGSFALGAGAAAALAMVPVVWRLRRLGIDRFVTSLLLRELPDLTPGEASRLIAQAYFTLVHQEGAGSYREGARGR